VHWEQILIEVITEESAFLSGRTSSGTSRTLIDNTKSMLVDRFCNYSIKVISGPGTGEENNCSKWFKLL
jgi:hypothetical protein